MKLLLVRHAIAEDDAPPGGGDDARALTPEGRRRMREAARGLRSLVPEIDVIATSPLVRACQTAEILAGEFPGARYAELPALAPGLDLDALEDWLRDGAEGESIALVGHQPDLGRCALWLVTGDDRGEVELKKGGACLIEFTGHAGPGAGVLRWLLAPSHLRKLGA